MKKILLFIISVIEVDLAMAAVFFQAWEPAVGCTVLVMTAGIVVLDRRWRNQKTLNCSWLLGKALEVSDPDHPKRIGVAALTQEVLNLGLLAIGSPGAGKTDSVMLGYISALQKLSPDSGWAFFDGKGDVDTFKKCVAMKRAPDFFFSSELPGSQSINLFQGEAHDVIDRISKVLIGHTDSTSFYMDEQRTVLSRIVPLLRQLPVATNLRDLYVTLAVKDVGSELLRRARDAGISPVDVALARQWLEQPFASRVKNVSGLLNRLFILVAGPYADRINAYQPDIQISDAVARGNSVYFHLPLTDYARDIGVAIIEIFAVEARRRQLEPDTSRFPYPLLFDDWGAFFHDGFGPFSARCRSARMPLSFGFQSHAQLRAVSSTYADELDDTIATKIIMRVQGGDTAQYAVRLLGKHDFLDVGVQHSPRGVESSLRYMRRNRIDERSLRQLQCGEAYVSSLVRDGERMRNPLWRLQFGLPNFGLQKDVSLPPARTHVEGEGLGLWNRYMNPVALTEIHRVTGRTKRVSEVDTDMRKARAEARAVIEGNPGLDTDPFA